MQQSTVGVRTSRHTASASMRPVSLACLALLLASGCDTSPVACTLIGCSDSLTVMVAGPDGIPPPGRYMVTVDDLTDDGTEADCAFTVGDDGTVSDEPGCALVAREDGAGVAIFLEPLTGQLQIDVTRNGALVTRQTVRPVYQDRFPNGIDCGAVCQTAKVAVTV